MPAGAEQSVAMEGSEQWIYACDPDGTPHEVYCEPIWLCGYIETFEGGTS